MAEFKLTNKAIEDLEKIWNYTYKVWPENQADKYYKFLLSNCQQIAINPNLGDKYEEITENLLGMKANRHIIFYRVLNEKQVEITRILHERMDLKKRIIK